MDYADAFLVVIIVVAIIVICLLVYIANIEQDNLKQLNNELPNIKSCFNLMKLDKKAAKELVFNDYDTFEKQIEQKAKEIHC